MSLGRNNFDVIIIGGGPAGLSAALWCVDLGLTSILIEKQHELGGQLLWTYNKIKNYLGCEVDNGPDLAERFTKHIENARVNRITGCEVIGADLENKTITLADGRSFSGKAIVIATGVRRRKLGVPGEDEFVGRGILESGVKSKSEVVGKTVVIVGGGDAAVENALILSETAGKVIVIHRRNALSARREFIDLAASKPNIEFIFNHVITAIRGDDRLESVRISDVKTEEFSKIASNELLIRIGVVPNIELFRDQTELDTNDYILINEYCKTSLSDIFAIGDIANPRSPTLNSAVGNGVTAIKTISWFKEFKGV